MTKLTTGDVELLPGEVTLKACRAQTATWGPFVSSGTLSVTNERLIWVRRGFNIVPGANVVIGLDQVRTCLGDDGFSRHRVLLAFIDGPERVFHVQVGVDGSDLANAINEARRKRGSLEG